MLEVRLLGQFEVHIHKQSVEIPSRPAQSLFSYLILNPGIAHRREMLAGLLWPDSTESNARGYLRHALWRVRKTLGDDYLIADNISITFNPNQKFWLDVAVLKAPARDGITIEQLIADVSVYKGDLLPGFYDEWVYPQRDRLHGIYEHKMGLLLQELIKAGRWRDIVEWGERWIATSPAPELAYRALMQAHSGSGNRVGVTTVYQRCKEALWNDVGIEPSELTQRTAELLLNEDVTIAESAGILELKENVRPGISSLLLTPFVGRQTELQEITSRLGDPTCRLLTLIGPGGIGKTRLALEVAKLLDSDFYFVPFSSISSPTLLVPTIADVLGLSFYGGQDPKARLLKYLQDKKIVLVLDNFEHLLSSVGLLNDLLHNAPNVKILTTSRVRLNLKGEWLYEVTGMDFPENLTTDHLEEFSAVKLFLRNARRLNPGFSLSNGDASHVAHICRLVEGLPLAIELASAWVRVLSPQEIAAELERSLDFLSATHQDTPSRHQNLRIVFEHSWGLLPEKEQEAFRKLSIFRGGFTRDAANQIANISVHTLSSLADRSLLRWSPVGRYYIHQTLCQYGMEILDNYADEKDKVSAQHCTYYASFIQKNYEELTIGQQRKALQTIEYEVDNLRAAWRWAIEHVHIETLDKMLDSLYEFYLAHGWFDEGVKNFDQMVALIRKLDPVAKNEIANLLLGRALARLGKLKANLGFYDDAKQHLIESLELARAYQVMEEVIIALNALGGIAWDRGEFSEALQYHHECEEICRTIGYQRGLALSLNSLGFNYMSLGQFAEAEWRLTESLDIYTALGDRMSSASPQGRLGWVAYVEGDFRKAQACFRQAIAISREFDNRLVMALDQAGLSVTLNTLQQHTLAKEIASECLATARDIEYQLAIVTALASLGDALRAEGDLQQAHFCLIEGFGIATRLKLMPMYLLLLIAWASLLADEGEQEQAAEVFSLILQSASDVKAFATEAQSRLNEIQTELSPVAFTTATERGKNADMQELVQSIVEIGQRGNKFTGKKTMMD